MRGVGEHVYGLSLHEPVAAVAKDAKIPCEGCAVAADINDTRGRHLNDGIKACAVAALARRINDYHIGMSSGGALGCEYALTGGENLLRLAGEECHIADMIALGVDPGISDGLIDYLHSVDMMRKARHGQRDSAYAAVKIPDYGVLSELCIFYGRSVQPCDLHRIDLKEGACGDAKAQISDTVLYVSASLEDALF